MGSPFFLKNYKHCFEFIIISAIFFGSVAGLYYSNIALEVQQRGLKIFPSENIRFFTFGYQNTVSGSMWLSYLPENGTCEQSNADPTYNPNQNSLNEILTSKMKPSRCHLSWVYHMLNVMSVLTPNFRSIYSHGGTILSVVVDDREGAKRIFDKGVQLFPNDWVLNYKASYHYLYELQNAQRAIELLEASYKNGGPQWLPSLIAGLYTETGRAVLAKTVIEDFLKTNPEGYALQRAKKRLEEINEILKKQKN